MKFSKSVLAVSLLLALQAGYAQGSIINEDKVINEATEVEVTSSSGNAANYVGIESSKGNYAIEMIDGAVLSIVGNQSTVEDAKEIYGILASDNSSLTFNGDSSIDLKAKDAILRAIRLDNGNLFLTGSHKVSLRSESTLSPAISLFAIDVQG